MATPYASMLLEQRNGEVTLVPVDAFTAGLNPSDADLQRYYAANRSRYMVPEQRVLRIARIGPDRSPASPPPRPRSRILKANQATIWRQAHPGDQPGGGPGPQRRQRDRRPRGGGQSFVAAAAPAGLRRRGHLVGPQTRAQFTELAGAKVAAAAFGAADGRNRRPGPVGIRLARGQGRIDPARRRQDARRGARRDRRAS